MDHAKLAPESMGRLTQSRLSLLTGINLPTKSARLITSLLVSIRNGVFLEPIQFDQRLTKVLFLPVKNNSQALVQFFEWTCALHALRGKYIRSSNHNAIYRTIRNDKSASPGELPNSESPCSFLDKLFRDRTGNSDVYALLLSTYPSKETQLR